ncbi:hypothetical protein SASPL_128763 [Salvia splendens]|uniref:Uncharacterized protein n=1 Tax=Salvia splendens TaxID=180675 RepID=A0A8X8ZN31_SALSN|nr:hypothetical protein SASPL_128763 [Salvia splendens]
MPLLLTVKSSSRLLSLTLNPSIDHLPLAVVQAPSATAASPAAVPSPPLKSWLRQHRKASSDGDVEGMGRAGCVPDCDSYGGLIAELSEARKVDAVAEVVREMM